VTRVNRRHHGLFSEHECVRCFRLPRLIEELARYAAIQKRSALYRQLARAERLVIDDFDLAPLADEIVRDLLEIFDDATIVAPHSSPGFSSVQGLSRLPKRSYRESYC
jgi:hypothetical protein